MDIEDIEQWGIILLLILAGIGTFFMLLLSVSGDMADIINVRELGTILCEERGLKYDHRETIFINESNMKVVPKIYCKNTTEKKILDGIIVLE